MKKLDKFIDTSSKYLCYIGCAVLSFMLLSVVVNVVGRRLFNFTIGGIIELVQYGMVTVMCLVMYRTTYAGGHVVVSVITDKLPKPVAKGLGIFSLLFAFALIALASYVCFRYVPINRASGLTTDYYHIPYWIVYLAVGIGLGLSALTFLFNAITFIHPIKKDEDAPVKAEAPADDGAEA